jgi:hypothetical protein
MSIEPGWPIHLWVFEATAGARRFHERIGGEVVEQRNNEVLKGITIPLVRYVGVISNNYYTT